MRSPHPRTRSPRRDPRRRTPTPSRLLSPTKGGSRQLSGMDAPLGVRREHASSRTSSPAQPELPSTKNAEEWVGGELESSRGRPQIHLVQPVLDRALENRRTQLVLREVRVEKEAGVPGLVPLASLPAFPHPLVEASAGQRVGDGVADVVERNAAGEVDAADQR